MVYCDAEPEVGGACFRGKGGNWLESWQRVDGALPMATFNDEATSSAGAGAVGKGG